MIPGGSTPGPREGGPDTERLWSGAAVGRDMRFGILGTAGIAARAFLPAIDRTAHHAHAVGSRDGDRARAFAAEWDIPHAYGSYEALLEDEALDALYVPLPNAKHAEWTKRAADRGLDVLCEKPLATTAGAAREVGDYCDDRGVTLMEAFMYRYHPRTERAVELARAFEDVRAMTAAFHWPLRDRPDDVRLSADLGGGSLLDLGVYAVTAVRGVLGTPERVAGVATDSRGAGVDTAFVGILAYPDGATARISAGFDTVNHERYRVEATDGWLDVDDAFLPSGASSLTVARDGERGTERFDAVDQYRLEIDHFVECVERDVRPRTDAAYAEETLRITDGLRAAARRGETVVL